MQHVRVELMQARKEHQLEALGLGDLQQRWEVHQVLLLARVARLLRSGAAQKELVPMPKPAAALCRLGVREVDGVRRVLDDRWRRAALRCRGDR